MKQYLVQAWDGDDKAAFDRRKKVRPSHLDGVRKLRETNNFVIGGAVLDDEGNMIGSMMVVQFESDDDLQAWLDVEPYIHHGVWATWDVSPFKVAEV